MLQNNRSLPRSKVIDVKFNVNYQLITNLGNFNNNLVIIQAITT